MSTSASQLADSISTWSVPVDAIRNSGARTRASMPR